jgi:hypothetical protein
MIKSCYVLELYCEAVPLHGLAEGYDVYRGISLSDCEQQARQDGWIIEITQDSQTAVCPQCAKLQEQGD